MGHQWWPLSAFASSTFDRFSSRAASRRRRSSFPPNAVIYQQGDPAEAVMYLQKGRVKLSVVSGGGKEAVLGVLGTR